MMQRYGGRRSRRTVNGRKMRGRRRSNLFSKALAPFKRFQSATGLSRRTVVSAGGAPPTDFGQVAKTWNAGGQQMFQNTSGLMGTWKKTGKWKTWRARKHIVVSTNPRLGTFLKGYGRLDTMMKRFQKQAPKARRSSTSKGGREVVVVEGRSGSHQ